MGILAFRQWRIRRNYHFLWSIQRPSSHGPTPEEIYAKEFRAFDEKLGSMRLDLVEDPARIEAFQREGTISEALANGHIQQIMNSRKSKGEFHKDPNANNQRLVIFG